MKTSRKILIGLAAILPGYLIYISIHTELRVRSAEQILNQKNSISAIVEKFGNPNEKRKDLKDSHAYSRGTPLSLNEGEELFVFAEEGIPYWNILIVTADGSSIARSQVNRLW